MRKLLRNFEPSHCYLGPEILPQVILKMLPYWRIFNYAGKIHDSHFRDGGNLADFKRANRIFRSMCLAAAKTPLQRNFAMLYAWFVDTFGVFFFAWKETCANLRKR